MLPDGSEFGCATIPGVPDPSTPSLIHARDLTKRFGQMTAVDAIDFDVAPGRSFGFLGPNGAGKTSTMRMIGAVSPRSGGTLRVLGMDPDEDGPRIWHASASSPSRTRWTWS